MVTLDRALLCLRHRLEAGQPLEDGCYAVAVSCKVGYDELLAAYNAGGQAALPKTKLIAGCGWPANPAH